MVTCLQATPPTVHSGAFHAANAQGIDASCECVIGFYAFTPRPAHTLLSLLLFRSPANLLPPQSHLSPCGPFTVLQFIWPRNSELKICA